MAPVADAIRRHGIVLLDARSIGATVAARTVEEAGGKALSKDMFVDGEPTRRAISTALDRLIRQAKARGHASGSARGLYVSLERRPEWRGTQRQGGVRVGRPGRPPSGRTVSYAQKVSQKHTAELTYLIP